MVVDNFDILGLSGAPPKANAKLIVYPDTELSCPCPFEGFEPVAGRDLKVVKPGSDLQLSQLAPGGGLEFDETLHTVSARQFLSV